IQRFHYLNSALKGPAARTIQSLGVSDSNYKVAWESLKSRYEDPVSLIHHHTNALLELASVKRHSSSSLREFIDSAKNHVLALGALGEPVNTWDTLLVLVLSKKLDPITQREWDKHLIKRSERLGFRDFVQFIEQQAKFLERTMINTQPPMYASKPLHKGRTTSDPIATHVSSAQNNCALCKGNHQLHHCAKLLAMQHPERHETVKRLQCCFNCLALGHSIKGCTRGVCRKCGRKHHTLLHRDEATTDREKPSNRVSEVTSVRDHEQDRPSTSGIQSYISNSRESTVEYTVLSTAIVYIEDARGNAHECRALLDVGPQVHFITNSFCERLGLPASTIDVTVGGLSRVANSVKRKTNVTIKSRCGNFRSDLSCLVIKNITEDMPNVPVTREALTTPSGILLADPQFDHPSRVDLLIGAGLFWKLLCIGQHRTGQGNLVWQKTRLGWILGGALTCPRSTKREGVSACHLATDDKLQLAIEKFWEVETQGCSNNTQTHPPITDAERHFTDTTQRDTDGRYIVAIPKGDNIEQLGESRSQAERRLIGMERRFSRNPELREQYLAFMAEYETLGHMTRVDVDDNDHSKSSYYLPHHVVFKNSSTTTKIRVVFDGSAKTSSGISLNDTQLVGPTVQSDLFSILLRFRKHRFVLSADIEKMYRQIRVCQEDRRLQRILWRSNPNSPIQTYELNTVTYGTAAAPFLATRVLSQIGRQHAESFPIASRAIIQDFYVDDLLTGCETIEEAFELRHSLIKILEQSGFTLRKWASNNPSIVTEMNENRGAVTIKTADRDPKTLGLLWTTESDELHYAVKSYSSNRITKRVILSEIAQIFDPLGLLEPIITKAKLIMQQLWQIHSHGNERKQGRCHNKNRR
ncbi:PREDICTED: uncharacterized protein LOC108578189, partial [Habropoda laboriosa]|uniref:uncharacterized protein LOC108578189 n=1 Tax=Habropoda laboriosa TaxID=597456 RepID=UPI00083D4301